MTVHADGLHVAAAAARDTYHQHFIGCETGPPCLACSDLLLEARLAEQRADAVASQQPDRAIRIDGADRRRVERDAMLAETA